MPVNKKGIRGISGRDNVCTLQPFDIIEIVPDEPTAPPDEEPVIEPEPIPEPTPPETEPEEPEIPEEPDDDSPLQNPPFDGKLSSFLDWLIYVLNWFKSKL